MQEVLHQGGNVQITAKGEYILKERLSGDRATKKISRVETKALIKV
jgi:hypothetical protein